MKTHSDIHFDTLLQYWKNLCWGYVR